MLQNDVGDTEEQPYGKLGLFATPTEVKSWGRLHAQIAKSVQVLVDSPGAIGWPTTPEAAGWLDGSEKWSDLAQLGTSLSLIYDHGGDILDSTGMIDQLILSAKEGKRLIGLLREQGDMPGGDEVGGTGGTGDTGSWGDMGLFAGGVVATGLAALYWKYGR